MSQKFRLTSFDFQPFNSIKKPIKRRDPYKLKLSDQINLARIKHPYLADEDFTHYNPNSFNHVGLAVTEKRTDSSICEVTIMTGQTKAKVSNVWTALEVRRRSNYEQYRRTGEHGDKILATEIVQVRHPDPVLPKSCCSAYECFRPTRLVPRRQGGQKYIHIRKSSRFQSPANYSNSISIQTEESPFFM